MTFAGYGPNGEHKRDFTSVITFELLMSNQALVIYEGEGWTNSNKTLWEK
jgi:hypothetical protein